MSDEMQAISVQIAKLQVKPGDVLVVKLDGIISLEQARNVRGGIAEYLPEGIKVLIIDGSASLAVLTREEIESRAE